VEVAIATSVGAPDPAAGGKPGDFSFAAGLRGRVVVRRVDGGD